MFQIIKQKLKKIQNDNHGLTLVELLVTMILLGIVSAIVVSSYTNVMEDQRKNADLEQMGVLDDSLMQILFIDDAFEEVKPFVYDKNQFYIRFPLAEGAETVKSAILLHDATLPNGTKLKVGCPQLYTYLLQYVGDYKILLTSTSYRVGYYQINITFNGSQVSEIRDYVINNDGMQITNTGDEFIFME